MCDVTLPQQWHPPTQTICVTARSRGDDIPVLLGISSRITAWHWELTQICVLQENAEVYFKVYL